MHKYTNVRLWVFYTCVSINSVIKWTGKGVVTMASKYGNPRGQAATAAKRNYNSKNYDRNYPYVKKGKKSVYQRAAKASGFDSINDMIESLMDERRRRCWGCRRNSSRQRFRPRRTRSRKRHKESGGRYARRFCFPAVQNCSYV